METSYFIIDSDQLDTLRRAASRLHSEDRMNGDEMRDLGHALSQIVRVCTDIPVPDEPYRNPGMP